VPLSRLTGVCTQHGRQRRLENAPRRSTRSKACAVQSRVTRGTQLRCPFSNLYTLKKSAFRKGGGGDACSRAWGAGTGQPGPVHILRPPPGRPTAESPPLRPRLPPCTAGEAFGVWPRPTRRAASAWPGQTSPFPGSPRDSAERQRRSVSLSHEQTSLSRQ